MLSLLKGKSSSLYFQIHNSRGDFQLRVTLENLLSAEQVGRWWIVGSAWSVAPMIDHAGSKTQQDVGEVSI